MKLLCRTSLPLWVSISTRSTLGTVHAWFKSGTLTDLDSVYTDINFLLCKTEMSLIWNYHAHSNDLGICNILKQQNNKLSLPKLVLLFCRILLRF